MLQNFSSHKFQTGKHVFFFLLPLLTGLVLIASSQSARAQSTWNNPGEGDWFAPGNWTPNGVPTGATNIIVDQGDAEISLLFAASSNSAQIGSATSTSGTVTVGLNNSWTNSGNLSVGGSGTGVVSLVGGDAVFVNGVTSIGTNTTGVGTVTITNNSSFNETGDGGGFNLSGAALTVGDSGQGTLNVTDNSQVNLTGTTATVSIGFSSGSTGFVNVGSLNNPADVSTLSNSGPNVAAGFPGNFYVGYSGTGTLNIYAGSSVTGFDNIDLGVAAGGNGTVNVNGGTLTFDPFLNAAVTTVGDAGVGTLTISNGGTVSDATGVISNQSGSADSSVTVTGTNSTWNNTSFLSVGANDTGTLTISNGGKVTDGGQLYLGQNTATASGTVTVDNGTLIVTQDIDIGLNGTGTMAIMNGGQVASSGGEVGISNVGGVTITGTGSQWDTTNNNTSPSATLFIGANHGGVGSVTVSDGGTLKTSITYLNFDGSTNDDHVTVTGADSRWINNSELLVGFFGTGSLMISDGGSVSDTTAIVGYTSTSAGTEAPDATQGIGTVTVTGSDSIWTNTGTLAIGDNSTNGNTPGFATGTATGTLNILDGGVTSNVDGYLGFNSGGIGTATVDGTGSTWTNTGNLYVGRAGTGTIDLQNGGAVSAGTLVIAGLNGSTGTLNIGSALTPTTGGTLTVTQIEFGTGAGTINFNQTDTFTLNAPISGSGMVNQDGSGTTILEGNSNYTGTTTISNGLMEVGQANALGNSQVNLSGGTLTVSPTNANRTITAGGGYSQTGGTLLFSIDNAGNDLLQVTGGSTALGGTLQVNLGGLSSPTAPGPVKTTKYTVVETGSGYTGTFEFDPTNVASGLTVTIDYATTPNDVLVDVTQSAVLFSTSGLSPNQQSTLGNINTALANGGGQNAEFITGLSNVSSNSNALGAALDQLTGEQFAHFIRTTVFNNASFQTQQIDSYLGSLRTPQGVFQASNGGIDASRLTMLDPNVDSGLAQVRSRLLAYNPAPLGHGLLSDVADPLFAGGIDSKEMAPETDPWNVFIQGNVVLAQDFSQADLSHINATTGAVELGANYRFTPHFLAGAIFGYGHTNADLDTIGSKATVDNYSPGVYASYVDGGWYANAFASYAFNHFTEDRNMNFGGFTGVAHGAPGGSQEIGNLDGGYNLHVNNWTFGPTVGLQYTHLTVDGYTEQGAGAADLSVNQEETDSLRSRLGGHVDYAMHAGGITLTPHFDASWQHEFLDQSRGITSQFDGLGSGSFVVATPNPSRDSALIDAGVNIDVNQQVTVFVDYLAQAGQANYFGQSAQAGVKIGF